MPQTREQRNEAARLYRAAHPERVAAAQAKYKRTAGGRGKKRYELRRAFLTRWKLAANCYDCGYNADAVALDFDHVIGEKKFSIGLYGGSAWKTLIAELAKCVVRCANCHRIKTHRKETE